MYTYTRTYVAVDNVQLGDTQKSRSSRRFLQRDFFAYVVRAVCSAATDVRSFVRNETFPRRRAGFLFDFRNTRCFVGLRNVRTRYVSRFTLVAIKKGYQKHRFAIPKFVYRAHPSTIVLVDESAINRREERPRTGSRIFHLTMTTRANRHFEVMFAVSSSLSLGNRCSRFRLPSRDPPGNCRVQVARNLVQRKNLNCHVANVVNLQRTLARSADQPLTKKVSRNESTGDSLTRSHGGKTLICLRFPCVSNVRVCMYP